MRLRLVMAVVAVVVMLAGAPLQAQPNSSPPKKPNIIVVLLDDLGYGDLGVMGAKDFDTPFIDSLALGGMQFTNGYISHPYCGPSRAGLMSGRYQSHIGFDYNPPDVREDEGGDRIGLSLAEETMPQALKRYGYTSVQIGKWHLGSADRFMPHNRGFDVAYGFGSGGRSFWPEKSPGFGKQMLLNGVPQPEDGIGYMTDHLTDFAIDYVAKSGDKPFFMYLAYNAPHAPDHAHPQDLAKTAHIMDPFRSVYAAMVVGVDRNMGRLIQALEAKGVREDTMIVFLSDNGGRIGAHHGPIRGHKGLMFEAGIRTPFIVNYPAMVPPGTRADAPVISLDLFPTAIALAGGDPARHPRLDGRNLTPLLTQQTAESPHERLFWREIDGEGWAVREGDWKLVKPAAFDRPMLFNLAVDPRETTDVTAQNPRKVAALNAAWTQWNREGKPTLWKDAHPANALQEYCAVVNKRAAALAPADRAAARCAGNVPPPTTAPTMNEQ